MSGLATLVIVCSNVEEMALDTSPLSKIENDFSCHCRYLCLTGSLPLVRQNRYAIANRAQSEFPR